MSYEVVIGMVFNQKFETGDITPRNTAIYGGFCHTVISCVGKAPADLIFDDSIGEMNYQFWKSFLMFSKGLKKLGQYIEDSNKQIIYLSEPKVIEIIAEIKSEIYKMPQSDYRERAKWLVFWAEESSRKYGKDAVIGLF